EQRQIRRRDALAADLAAWERTPLDERDRPAGPREPRGRGRAGNAGAEHDHIVSRRHAARLATNRWLKRPAPRSVSRHAPPRADRATARDHVALSSASVKPARTLAIASCRVTSFAPIAPSSRLPASAMRERRGSQQ